MIRLAVFGLDKTLLDDRSRLPEDFDRSLQTLKAAGVKVGVASARTFFSIQELFGDRMELLTGTCDNGNTIFHGNRARVLNCWKEEDIRYLLSFLDRDPDIGLIFSGMEDYYADPLTVERCRTHGRDWMAARIRSIDQAIQDGVEICNCHFICFWENYPSILACVEEKLRAVFYDVDQDFSLLEAGWGWIAVTKAGGGKPAGLRKLMEAEGAAPEETCVFGDSDNDVPMFNEVKYSYAMKNAYDSVKAAAAYITEEDNNHNGAMKAAIARAVAENGIKE